jgi:hypothetical protein
MWQEVISSDRAADDETIAYTARVNPQAAADPAKNPGRYHFLDFLTNAYLQLGQDQQAKRIVDARNSVAEYPANFRYSEHTAFAAKTVVERLSWAVDIGRVDPAPTGFQDMNDAADNPAIIDAKLRWGMRPQTPCAMCELLRLNNMVLRNVQAQH